MGYGPYCHEEMETTKRLAHMHTKFPGDVDAGPEVYSENRCYGPSPTPAPYL